MIQPAELSRYLATLPFLGRVLGSHRAVTAGDFAEIVLTYQVGAAALADGAWLKIAFKFYSDWAPFQTTRPDLANYLSATYVRRAEFPGESPATVRALKVRFDQKGHERPYQKAVIVDVLDGYLKPGDRIELRLGDRRHGGPGTRVQTFAETGFRFRAFVDTAGTSRFATVPGDVVLDVLPGPAARAVLRTPRLARPGAAVPVTLAFEDAWGNPTAGPTLPTVLSVTGAAWRGEKSLAGQGATWARTTLQLTAGEYRIETKAAAGVPAAHVPLTITPTAPESRALFADLHIHSEDTVGTNDTRSNLTAARDGAGLDIAGYTANDFNVRADRWADAVAICRELHAPGNFLCFPGTEWCGSSAVGGDRNVVFLGDEVRFPVDAQGRSLRVFDWNEDSGARRTQEAGLWPASALHDAYRDLGRSVLLIPHVGGRRAIFDWHDAATERLVEIASSWGHFDWFYRDALARGLKVGASAAGDEHRGRPGGGAPGVGSFGVRGGLTGVLAAELTSPVVAAALHARRTWATTGERNVALLSAGAHRQGDEFIATGPTTVNYAVYGETGWELLELRDAAGRVLLQRDLDRELGYAAHRVRIRWGGARIKDRYRWAEWRGTIRVTGTPVLGWRARGLEHPEERVAETAPGVFTVATDTYGDADHLELDVGDLAALQLEIDLSIGAYNKTGDPLAPNPNAEVPHARRTVRGDVSLAAGAVRWELGGAELFLAVERLTAAPLPLVVEGDFTVPASVQPTAVYVFARERDDAKVWTSPLFLQPGPS